MSAPAEPRPDTAHTDAPSARGHRDETIPAPTGAPAVPGFGPPVAPGEVGTLGPYRVVKELGKGGMGAVYAAIDTRLDRRLALKVMLPAFAADAHARERFLREAKATAKVKHDHVVTVYEADEREGVPYIAMEFLDGLPLDAYLKRKGGPSIPQVLRIGVEAASGLAAAHALGLVHRDVKPANLWLESPNGRVKVLDFGLARPADADTELTKSGAVVGTPAYMSPEQARGERVDHRTDLFSLGALLYRLCAGRTPFSGATTMAVLIALATEEPPPIRDLNRDVPVSLAALIHQLLAKHPGDRPASAAEVVERLHAIASTPDAPARAAHVAAPAVPAADPFADPFADLGADDTERTEPDADEDSAPAAEPVRASPGRLWLWPAVGFAAAVVAVAAAVVAITSAGGSRPTAPVPAPAAATGAEAQVPPVIDPDRAAAQWVIRQGGFVRVNGTTDNILTAAQLPPGRFELTVVALTERKVTDAEVSNLKGLKSLSYLVLWNTGVSDAALQHLAGLPALKILDLYGTSVNGTGLKHLKDCPNLTHIDLGATPISDAGLEHLKELRALVQLDLYGTAVSDAGLKHLKELHWLNHLLLGGTNLTAAGRAELAAALPGCALAPLDPDREAAVWATRLGGYVRVNSEGTNRKTLAELPKGRFVLTLMSLRGTKVTDAELAQLQDLNDLKTIELSDTRVSDAGLAHLKELKNLLVVRLNNTRVSDAGLESLKDLKHLGTLDVQNTKMTPKALAAFGAAMPKCTILHDGGIINPKR